MARRPYSDYTNGSKTYLITERLYRRWRQKDVAARIGVSRSVYAQMESGLREGAEEHWDKLALLFGLDKDFLKGEQ